MKMIAVALIPVILAGSIVALVALRMAQRACSPSDDPETDAALVQEASDYAIDHSVTDEDAGDVEETIDYGIDDSVAEQEIIDPEEVIADVIDDSVAEQDTIDAEEVINDNVAEEEVADVQEGVEIIEVDANRLPHPAEDSSGDSESNAEDSRPPQCTVLVFAEQIENNNAHQHLLRSTSSISIAATLQLPPRKEKKSYMRRACRVLLCCSTCETVD